MTINVSHSPNKNATNQKGNSMPGSTIADLAVLGISQTGPIAPQRLVVVAKTLVPDLWNPTAGVIDAAICRNLSASHLVIEDANFGGEDLELTIRGSEKLRGLLLHDPGHAASPATHATEAIQFCFLDAADPETAELVLVRMQTRLHQRLSELRQRCRRCPHNGRYVNLWMGMEQRRLEAAAQMLAVVTSNSPSPRNSLAAEEVIS